MSLTDTLPLGPVNLPLWIVALALAALVLKLTLRFTLSEEAKPWEASVWNALVAGFAVWKLSPLFSAWDTVQKEPLSLLYLPGSGLGLASAIVIVLGWLGWKVWKSRGTARKTLVGLGAGLAASAVAVLIFTLGLSAVPQEETPTPTQENQVVLGRLDGGNEVVGNARGKVLFVNFWATWCPPCRAEIPEFVAFWDKADSTRVAVQAVDLMTSEQDPSLVPTFAQTEGMKFPILLDSQGKAATLYQIESIPTTLVFDPAGNLVFRHTGAMTREMLESLVRQYQK